MRGYEEYRESRVKWLGEIPAHWEVVRLKYTGVFEHGLTYSTSNLTDNTGTLVLRSSNVQSHKLSFSDCVYVDKVPQDLMVKRGDIIICSSNGSADLVGKCAYVDEDIVATFGSFMMRYRTNILSKFAFYTLQTAIPAYKGLFTTSTIYQLTKRTIGKIYIPVPPKDEQDQIARFLDWKISAIDRLIFLRHRQLTDLEDLKKSAISRAVTRALNPEVELRDSGVKWLGQIPSGWEVVRLKRVAKINPPCDSYGLKPEDLVTFAPMECIRTDKRIPLDVPLSRYNSSYNVFNNGDIALAKVTPCFENDNVCIMENLTNGYAFGSSELFNVRPFNVWPKYLLYYFMTQFFKSGGIASMTGAIGLKRVSSKYLRNALLPLPPTAEQQQISTYLDKLCSLINQATSNLSTQIDTLRELKARLISDTVTGKIDVRHIPIPGQENP